MNYSAFRAVGKAWAKAVASTVAVSMVLTSFAGVSFFINPTPAYAATNVFTEDFGSGNDLNDIPGWEEHESGTIARKGQGSGEDIASPNGGRFAKIAEDGNDNGNEDGWICREVNAEGYESLQLSYYWNGAYEAENSDAGIVEARNNGNGDANCGANGGWTQLKSHNLENHSSSWHLQSAFSISDFDDTKFLIRFRNSASADDEDFRVDGIVITGEEQTPPVTNPALANSCGLDIALVMDVSGSIDNTELGQMKTALKSFVDAFNGTPTLFSVSRFRGTGDELQSFTANFTDVKTAIDSANGTSGVGSGTNWVSGLTVGSGTFDPRPAKQNVIVFATDGNPTDPGSDSAAVDAAVTTANGIKTAGTRIIALGIGNDLNVDNLKAISGPNLNTGDASVDVITSNFATLGDDLAALAADLCGGTITVTKLIDVDGNPATTEDQTVASGWEFNVAGSTETTDESGKTNAVQKDAGTYSVTETVKDGYEVIDAYCANEQGSWSGGNSNAITNIELGDEETITCTFVNVQGEDTSEIIVVDSNNQHGWLFVDDNDNSILSDDYVFGPDTAPLGNGSAHLAAPTSGDRDMLALATSSVRLSNITALTYKTYQASTSGAPAIALQFNIDADINDLDNSWQGRLVYEPYYTHTIQTGAWQSWNTQDNSTNSGNGNWWFSNGTLASNTGCSIATPCTWDEVVAALPNGGIHPTLGAVLFKVGGGWTNFDGNVDEFVIGIKSGPDTHTTTYDFEPLPEPDAKASIRVCKAMVDPLGNVIDGTGLDSSFSVTIAGPYNFSQTVTFNTPLTLTENLLDDNGDDVDGACVLIEDLPAGNYTYTAEDITGDHAAAWDTPLYHDFFNSAPKSVDDFFVLTQDGQEGDNDNADGSIVLGATSHRTLAIVNTLKVPQCAPGQELLVNPSFENPPVTSGTNWDVFASGTTGLGWVAEWLNITGDSNQPAVANIELQKNGLFSSSASDGVQWTELDSDWNGHNPGPNGEQGAVAISQTILTAVGETYTFSFDFSARPNTPAAQNAVNVLVEGATTLIDETVSAGAQVGVNTWTNHSFSFVADSVITKVTLQDAGSTNNSEGTLIDNASLMCVEPEPENPWCSFEGQVFDYSEPAYKNSGAPVDTNRRNVSGIENGPASYQNVGGKDGNNYSPSDFFSLGINGWLVYEFTGQAAYDQAGPDIGIYEITGGTSGQSDEKVEVLVSQNGIDFFSLGTYTGDALVDIAPAGLDFVKFVKLIDDSAGVQGASGDGYDVDAIVILNGSCGEDPGPQFATVTLCKLDTNENTLAGWTLSLLGDQVDEVNVPANTLAGADSTSLNAGTPYVAFASGVWLNNRNPDNHVDAEYSTEFGNTNTVNADWTGQTIMDGFIGYGANILDLQVNDQFINWGTYNSTHEYAYAFTPGVTDAVNFRIFDGDANTNTPNAGWYGDNSGSLNVDIYKGYAGVTDEQSGCVVFEQVPLGSYTVSELAQQGWQNVSGLGSVTVDEGQETFNVVNVELDTITVEKWSDEDQDGSWDENENGVAGWDMVVKPETLTPVSEFTVSSASQTGTDSSTLTDGRTYLVEVSGTYQYAGNSTKIADAGFYSTNNWSSHGEWGSDNPSEDQRTLNLIVDDAEINWGTYNSDHLYKALLTGDDAAVNFRVFERQAGHYPDNTGDLTVRIYDVTDYVVTTGENGSATLEVLPGEYQVVEMQREGWTQTAPTAPSYCHIDTTDDSDHTCTFGNYETPTAPDLATLVGTKIVCDAEQYLPNWGTGAYGPITATTATDWLAEGDNSKYCHLESGWEFEWVTNSDSSSNPGDNVGAAGSPWTSTGLTAGDGTVSTQIPAGERVWVREVLKDGFIGFAGQTTQDDDSAELYCSTDVLNYDNWDYIDPVNTDETYYCVAWNAPVPGAPELTIVKETESYDDVFYFGVSSDYYEFNALPNITTEQGYGETTVQLPGAGTFNVLELLDEDWVLSDVWCEYNSESEVGSPLSEQDGYQVTLEDGDQVTCYFYNEVSCSLDTHFDQSEGTCVPNEGENYFDLAVDKTVAHDGTPAVGEPVTYTIHLTISGDSNAGSIYVYDLLPSGVTYQSHTASNGNENYDEESGEWYVAGLTQGGEGATLTITATINNGEEGQTITNTATISDHDGVDTNSENNSDGASFTVEDDEEEGGGGGPSNPTPQTFLGGGITGLGGGNGFVLGASTERLGESCGLYMDRFLRYGYPGNNAEQVEKLQQFLNKHGFGALNITGIFGIDTENAVKKFQQTYANEILTPWGLNAPTGLVYITTLRQINLIECPQLSLQVPELIAWSLANGASVADSLTGNGTQSNGGNTGGSDDSGSENNQDQAASVGGAVKGQGFWNRVWNFFFKR